MLFLFFAKRRWGSVQQLQAKPRRGSNRVALSYRLIESSLSRLLMLELIYLTAPLFETERTEVLDLRFQIVQRN